VAITAKRLAKLGMTSQFLALVRSLFEIFRLKYAGPLTLREVEPYVVGSLIAAICAWIAVTLFFFDRHGIAIGVSAATVVALLIYKLYAVG
jgi:hypothetical protein